MTRKRRRAPAGSASEEPGDQVLFVRVPAALIQRLDKYVETERERTGYRSLARSDVVRKLLDAALKAPPRTEK